MMREEKHETREVFTAAMALTTPAERARYLDEVCRGKPELRQRVEALLRAHDQAGGFLERTVRVAPASDFLLEHGGVMIGRYKLLQEIGEGGFGQVFMAEQKEPVQRKVALKIIKAGMDTKEVIARFQAERQALALMDHPNIARVLDAGTTEAGRPYFVMELVRGIPITEYCDRDNLPMTERLELFMQVCHAVQHAHQKAIIHRDLKPTNILVTMIDGKPVPKIIDFGVAKALGQKLTEKTLFTAFEQIIGTPAYMSPEQAALSGVDVDTRSDIYSLGVLLYELLTGVTPFDNETFHQAALDEIRRMIRETEPPKPSTRLRALGDKLAEVAQHRQTEPSALTRSMHGDLDWIVMKCLEKDRARRYETAGSLAEDLQRHVEHQPVQACPPGTLYLANKFIRRHRMGVAMATTLTLALVTGLTAALIGFNQATHEWDRAERLARAETRQRQLAEANYQMAREVVDRMLTRQATDLANRPHMARLRRDLLEDALKFHLRFLEQKANDPELRHAVAQTYMRVGGIYQSLGQHERSVEPWGRALTLLEELAQQNPSEPQFRKELAQAHAGMAFADMWLDRMAECVAQHRQELALYEGLQDQFPDVPEYLTLAVTAHVDIGNELGWLEQRTGSLAEMQQALRLYNERRTRFPNLPEDPAVLVHVIESLGGALARVGRLEEAEQKCRQAHELHTQLVAEQPRSVDRNMWLAYVKVNLADVLKRTGRAAEAEEFLRQAIAIDDQLLDDYPDHANLWGRAGDNHRSLGHLLWDMRHLEEAETELRRAVEIHTRLVRNVPGEPVLDRGLAWSTFNLGQLLQWEGKSEAAAKAFADAIVMVETVTLEHAELPTYQVELEKMLALPPVRQSSDWPRAVTLAQQIVQHAPKSPACWHRLGVAQYRAGDPTAAIEALQKSRELRGHDDPRNCLFLALALRQCGKPAEAQAVFGAAEPAVREALAIQRKTLGNGHRTVMNSLVELTCILHARVKPGEADGICRELTDPLLQNNLAWRLATSRDLDLRDGQSALCLAQRAVAATARTNANYLDTLAAAYAEVGQFTNAIRVQWECLALPDPEHYRQGYEARLRLYQSGSPFQQ